MFFLYQVDLHENHLPRRGTCGRKFAHLIVTSRRVDLETNTSIAPAGTCAECRKVFPIDEMIRSEEIFVCGNCKPLFMQKLAEGASVDTGKLKYAGIGRRIVAMILDGLLLLVVNT